ncbi:hypothetical protein LF887_04545 [Chryseobacterium sp. MEBOG06]|uniref:hypothetical protein n=1 Tax=unclassified Chryseobacterium TaxID=2593645 RepID=UPI001F3A2622|nr:MULTISPECIES: hypothetical protein [unclassified Chryseobacterium]UKB84905.1 hypothetical protein LF887_04545 [Chryseobacterium sp. MEBOG06]
MNNYNFYKKEGSQYIFKNQPVFVAVLSLFFLVVAGFTFNSVRIMSLILIALVVLIVINFFTKKFIIDMDQKTITGKHTVFASAKTYSIQDFTNFEVIGTKYLGLFTVNVALFMHFEVNGKQEKLTIGQAVTHKGIQKMINETEDIMNINEADNERNRPV